MAERSLWRKLLNLVGIEEYDAEYSEEEFENPKVIDFNSRNQTELMIVNVESFEDAKRITSILRARKGIVLNLRNVIKEEAKRIIDFVCGTTFALNGDMQKITEEIFIFTPYNIHISEEKKGEEKMPDVKEA